MAFPYIFESNFETLDGSEWEVGGSAVEDDGAGVNVTFPHYTELATVAGKGPMAPFRGAGCMKVELQGGTAEATVTSDNVATTVDTATAVYFRFYFMLCDDFAFTADDVINIFEIRQSENGTVEAAISLDLDNDDGSLTIGANALTAATSFGSTQVSKNQWHCVELQVTPSTGSDAVTTLWLDGAQQTTETNGDWAASGAAITLGVKNELATTTGTILFDEFVADDARLHPIQTRYPYVYQVTKSTHVFVGPGALDSAALMEVDGNMTLKLWDSDRGAPPDAYSRLVVELGPGGYANVDSGEHAVLEFHRGCYAELGGTNPRATLVLAKDTAKGPRYYSTAGVRNYAHIRKQPRVSIA